MKDFWPWKVSLMSCNIILDKLKQNLNKKLFQDVNGWCSQGLAQSRQGNILLIYPNACARERTCTHTHTIKGQWMHTGELTDKLDSKEEINSSSSLNYFVTPKVLHNTLAFWSIQQG